MLVVTARENRRISRCQPPHLVSPMRYTLGMRAFLQKVSGISWAFVASGSSSSSRPCHQHLQSISTYLDGFVKPSVPTVEATASSMQHLSGHGALVGVIRHPWHRCIQADSANALLNRTHGFLVGLIWRRNEQHMRIGSRKRVLIEGRLKFERAGLKDPLLGSHCTSMQYWLSRGV